MDRRAVRFCTSWATRLEDAQTLAHYASRATIASTRGNEQSRQRAVQVAEYGRGGRQKLPLGVHQHGVLVGGERVLGTRQVDHVEVRNERFQKVWRSVSWTRLTEHGTDAPSVEAQTPQQMLVAVFCA